ncbi:restriction endonuclease subunit S [Streptococcus thermophilus]|nr:restriction endonuclease subunit S [Streptococcus thermophilus]MCE2333938.1 restriction endonuclease subunit S [Streptococcus thermophilus]
MIQKRIPSVRFIEYSDVWAKTKLNRIANIIGGGTPDTKQSSYWNGGINWFSPTEVGETVYLRKSEKTISQLGLQKSSAKLLPAFKTILFTSRAGIGDVGILTEESATNQGFQSLVVNEGIDVYFLYSYSDQIKKYALKHSAGSTFLEISGKELGKMDLNIPSLPEQSSIGSLFRTLDDLLASYNDNLANYQSLKATMLSKMFPKAGQTVPEIRLDGFEGEWEAQTLKELASFSKGNGYTKNDLVNSGEEIILYGRLYTNYQTIISKVNTFVTTVKANAVISKGGEVIVPASGESAEDISRASVVDKSGVILGGDLNIIYPDENKVDSIFLALTISNGSQQKELIKRAQGKSIVHLRNNDLEKVVLHYPSLKEQQAIGSYFSNLDNLINSHQEKISQLETLKKKLLQDMFI